jgi:putative sigma-54 modulation protein
MEFEFTGRHVVFTPALQKIARKELEKLDPMLDATPMRAHVILSVEKHRQCAEIVLSWRDNVFTAEAENNDLSQSITAAANKVHKQVLRLKEKLQTHKRRRSAAKSEAAESVAAPDGASATRRIIAARRYRVKPMTPEEAAVIVSDSPDQFIVFRDAETGRVGVLYKRKDGHYGLIEP